MNTENKPIAIETKPNDLISREALKEDVSLLVISVGGQPVFHKEAKQSVLKLIDEQPVAKDEMVAKLMAENKKLRAERDDAIACITPNCSYCAKVEDCKDAHTGLKNPYDCFVYEKSKT